jgi:hypothetical protein
MRSLHSDCHVVALRPANKATESDNCLGFESTGFESMLLHAMVELEQRYLPTMNLMQSIDRAIGLYFLLEHQYSSCLARTHLAFVGHPRVERVVSADSLATPSDLGPVSDVN